MKIAVFQFASTDNISHNFSAMERAVLQASAHGVRVLVFHECALCGYPPVETEMDKIDFELLNASIVKLQQLAIAHDLYIAFGTIRKDGGKLYNATQLLAPSGEILGHYDKRALWGWDLDHFSKGNSLGIFEIDGVKIGFRICFEVRFPEYFRELFRGNAELCFVSFCDVSESEDMGRYEIIKAHLRTRAVENVMTVVSVNSISNYQTAPTAVFDINGTMRKEAPRNEEHLLLYDHTTPEIGWAAEGRIQNARDAMNL